jgi:hypothetical protein
MAKVNEGDIIEGIFTIALSLYIAYSKIEKDKLNKIRTQVDTKLFSTGRFKYTVAENVKRQHKKKPADIFNVKFEMRLKSQESVRGAFDKEYKVLYSKSRDVGDIAKKIDQLIKSIENSPSYIRKVDKAINSFLDNNRGEIVDFVVIADGVAGESSGGEVKGDVTLTIYARKKGSEKKILTEAIPFSLKSESATVANLSPYNGMLDLAKAFGIKWNAKDRYIEITKKAKTNTEKAAKFKLIESMYKDLKAEINKKSRSPDFTKNALEFLSKNIFGSDYADIVDIRSTKVKEITKEYFDAIKQDMVLVVEDRGNNLVFVDKKTNNPFFQIRTKLRKEANEAKFYLEVGTEAYNK